MANKTEFVAVLSEKLDITKKDAARITEAVLDTIIEQLAADSTVQFAGFGTFRVTARAAREGFNPRTEERIQIPASNAPSFRAGKRIKEAVNPVPGAKKKAPAKKATTPTKKAAPAKKAPAAKAPAKKAAAPRRAARRK